RYPQILLTNPSRKPPRIMPSTRIASRHTRKPFFAYLGNRGITDIATQGAATPLCEGKKYKVHPYGASFILLPLSALEPEEQSRHREPASLLSDERSFPG